MHVQLIVTITIIYGNGYLYYENEKEKWCTFFLIMPVLKKYMRNWLLSSHIICSDIFHLHNLSIFSDSIYQPYLK